MKLEERTFGTPCSTRRSFKYVVCGIWFKYRVSQKFVPLPYETVM